MMQAARSWFSEHGGLVTFLIGQALAVVAAVGSLVAYSARLESRVHTLEVRGSPHLERIDNRLATLESQVRDNAARLDRVVDVMTRELNQKK
jgi:chaperonin cofactor prefoldin